jgi:hypothetical protein
VEAIERVREPRDDVVAGRRAAVGEQARHAVGQTEPARGGDSGG